MNKVTIDTNLIIDDENVLLKLSKKYDKIIIPLTVIKELDKLKHRADTSYSARRAIQAIRAFKNTDDDKIEFHINDVLCDDNDALIIKTARETESVLATKDLSMSLLSDAEGIETEVYDVILNNIYKPYVFIDTNTIQSISTKISNDYFGFLRKYEGEKANYFKKLLSIYGVEHTNRGWYFIMIENIDNSFIYAYNPLKDIFERIDNSSEYHSIEFDYTLSPVKALDKYQICAIYALKEAPHTIITGQWGSGKSLLTTAYSLYKSVNKTFLSRAPKGVNNKYDLGFMPGNKDEKMTDWLSGVISSLYYMFANTRNQSNGKGINYDYVKDSIFKERFDIIPINAIQGLSLLENDVLLVDEIQLLDIDTMSMLLSRPSKKGELVLVGDLNQTYSALKPSESGLLKLLRVLPHPSVALVELKNSYRSDILELADKLQDRTIC